MATQFFVIQAMTGKEQRFLSLGFVRYSRSNTDIKPLGADDRALIKHFPSFGEIVAQSKVVFDENNRIVVREGALQGLEGRIVKAEASS